MFALALIIVTFLLFNVYSIHILTSNDITLSEVKNEIADDIHETVFSQTIERTSYQNGSREIIRENLSIPRAIKDYIYLNYLKNELGLNLDLTKLKEDINDTYHRCAWKISHYHYGVSCNYLDEDYNIFFSDECKKKVDMPDERSASTMQTTFSHIDLRIILYIWK